MASFWDRVKSILGGQMGGGTAVPPSDLERSVDGIMRRRMSSREMFEPIDVADEATAALAGRTVSVITFACALVERLFDEGRFASFNYTRTKQADGNWVYHPKGADPSRYTAPLPAAGPKPPAPAPTRSAPAPAPAPARSAPTPARPAPTPAKASPPKPSPKDPLDAGSILGLSADEMRKRALRIDPYRTAWIGRVDTIPPQSDERTALIDRGLILRGFLTEPQLAEIHKVGDLWLRHHDAARMATIAATKAVDKALEDRKKEKAELKARKKRDAARKAADRAAAVAHRKQNDILYLGRGVSGMLGDRRSHIEALQQRGLPVLSSPADLAHAMGLTIPALRFLCFHSEATAHPHYAYFEVPKRSGGKRLLAAPQPRLAAAQAWVLHTILDKLPTEAEAHGFIKGRSTVTCAGPHVGRDLVVNLDLSDFFPTVGFGRVRGMFRKLGYSASVATLLALLSTESPRVEVELDGVRTWVAVGPRALPQGACTSPAISNQIAKKLDRRLAGMSGKYGFAYTRYADDLTFSTPPGKREGLAMFLARVRHIVEEEGFAINPKKGRVQRAAGRQTVTGIVVNRKPAVPREEVRKLRAILHHARTTGLEAQNREGLPHFEAHIQGKIAYLHMVDPARARPLMDAFAALRR
ncbi:MAG: reverse transcriptase family protein [Byssovorax sp.]